MAKKRQRQQPAAAAKAPPKPNLFEQLSSRKKFDVIGRKSKSETKQITRLRSAANERVGGAAGRGGQAGQAVAASQRAQGPRLRRTPAG